MYYNPFSNALQHSAQPDAPFHDMANPDHGGNLANNPALIDWINEEVDLENKVAAVRGRRRIDRGSG